MLRAYSKNVNRTRELTRRISDEEEKKTNEILSTLPNVPETIHELIKAINFPHWEKNKWINHPQMAFYALIANQEKLISDFQFATLMLYRSIKEYYSDEHKITSTFFQLDTTDPTFAKINEEIQKLPFCEQICFVVPHEKEEFDVLTAISRNIQQLTFNTNPYLLRIPSFSILQILIKHFHPYPATINPVLGLSSPEDILKNGIDFIRDIAIHFPGIFLPTTADFTSAILFKFTLHDFYHLIRVSDIPPNDRLLFIEIGKIIENIVSERTPSLAFLTWLPTLTLQFIQEYAELPEDKSIRFVANTFYDMDFGVYEKNLEQKLPFPITPETQFIMTIIQSLASLDVYNDIQTQLKQFSVHPEIPYATRQEMAFRIFKHLTSIQSPYIPHIKEQVQAEMDEEINFVEGRVIQHFNEFVTFWGHYEKNHESEVKTTEPITHIATTPDKKVEAETTPMQITMPDKIMQWGESISGTFDNQVSDCAEEILDQQYLLTRWGMDHGWVSQQSSIEIFAGAALDFSIGRFGIRNPVQYLFLPYADLSAKAIGKLTYSVGALLKSGLLLWRQPHTPEISKEPGLILKR